MFEEIKGVFPCYKNVSGSYVAFSKENKYHLLTISVLNLDK